MLLTASCNDIGKPNNKRYYLANSLSIGDVYALKDGNKSAELKIKDVGDNTFDFSIHALNGNEEDNLSGTAISTGFKIATYSTTGYDLTFNLINDSYIMLKQQGGNAQFEGAYFKTEKTKTTQTQTEAKDTLPNMLFLGDALNKELIDKTGNHYADLALCLKQFELTTTTETSIDYKVYSGRAAKDKAIIMIRGNKYYYAALLKTDIIYLYTNDPVYENAKGKYPKTIENWLNTYPKVKVEYVK
jgi:hypothetical protein